MGSAQLTVLDTDVASRIFNRDTPPQFKRVRKMQGALTLITVAEMLQGAHKKNWGFRRFSSLERFIGGYLLVEPDYETAVIWGEFRAKTFADGITIPENDAWIAACCIRHNLPLATLNRRHFDQIEGLELL